MAFNQYSHVWHVYLFLVKIECICERIICIMKINFIQKRNYIFFFVPSNLPRKYHWVHIFFQFLSNKVQVFFSIASIWKRSVPRLNLIKSKCNITLYIYSLIKQNVTQFLASSINFIGCRSPVDDTLRIFQS